MATNPLPYRPTRISPFEAPQEEAGFARQAWTAWTQGPTNQALLWLEGKVLNPPDPAYNPWTDLKGYEPYAASLVHARSQGEMDWMKSQVDFNLSEKSKMSGGIFGFGAQLAGGLLDPVNLVPVPMARGVGFVKGIAEGAASNAALAAVTDPLRIGADPTASWNELAYSIGGATLLGGALGGVSGARALKAQDVFKARADFDRLVGDLSDMEGANIARPFNAAEENYDVVPGHTGSFVDGAYEPVKVEVVEATLGQKKGPDGNLYHYDNSLGWVLEADRGRPDPRPVSEDIRDALGTPEKTTTNRMVVDEAALKKDFEDGRTGLPEGEVRTPGEYVTFKQIEAVWKKRDPQGPGETRADWQSRIRQSALEELKASRASASVARRNMLASFLDKANFSPVAKAIRMFAADNVMGDLPLQLGGDYGWAVRANEFGYKTPPSLLLRAMRHGAAFAELRDVMDSQWLKFVQKNAGAEGTRFMGQNITAAAEGLKARARQLAGQTVMTKEIFSKLAGRAVFDQSDFEIDGFQVTPEAREAAKAWTRIAQRYDAEARDLGIFYDQASLQRTARKAGEKIARIEAKMAKWLWGATGEPEALVPAIRVKVKVSDFKTPDAGIYEGFHGSERGFTKFDRSKLGENTGAASAKMGFFFSKTAETANTYTGADQLHAAAMTTEELAAKVDSLLAERTQQARDLQTRAEAILTPAGLSFGDRWRVTGDTWDIVDYGDPISDFNVEEALGLPQDPALIASRQRAREAMDAVNHMVRDFNDIQNPANKFAEFVVFDNQLFSDFVGGSGGPPDGASVHPVKLVMKNPYVYDQRGQGYRERKYAEIIATAKREGHDSVIIKNTYDTNSSEKVLDDIYVVFDDNQIVSTFDQPRLAETAQMGDREVDQVFTGDSHEDAYLNALDGDPNLSLANLPPGAKGWIAKAEMPEPPPPPAEHAFTTGIDPVSGETTYQMDGAPVSYDTWSNEKIAYMAELDAHDKALKVKPEGRTFRTSEELTKNRLDNLTEAQRRVYDDWKDQLDGLELARQSAEMALAQKAETPHTFRDQFGNPEPFFARFWNHMAIGDQRERFHALLTDWYRRDNPVGAEERATKTIDQMLSDEDSQDYRPAQVPGLRHLVSRKLDMPNSFVTEHPTLGKIAASEFFNTDLEVVAEAYLRGMGTKIEAAKMFGDANLWDKSAEIRSHYVEKYVLPALEKGANAKEITALLAKREEFMGWIDLIKRGVMGGLKTRDPWTFDNRVARNLKNFQVLTSMGRVLLTSIPEAMRLPMVNGFRTAFGAIWDRAFLDFEKIRGNVELSRETGEIFDLVKDVHAARIVEVNTPDPTGAGTYLERLLQRSIPPYFKLVGLTHWTVMAKDMLMFGAQHRVMDMARNLDAGENAFKLAAMGISKRDAKLLASMPVEQHGHLILPAVTSWHGADGRRARTLLLDAIHGEARRAIVTPSIGDKSLLFSGIQASGGRVKRESDLMSVPLQFLSYGIAANQKVLMSGLQGRDHSFVMGALAMMMMGTFANYLRQPQTATMNKSTEEWLLEGYEASGVGAFWFSDLNQMIERYSRNTVGLRPALGIDPRFGRTTDVGDYVDAAGPSLGTLYDVVAAFADPDKTASNRAQALRRAVPYNNVIWWGSVSRDLATKAAQPFK